MTLDLAKLELLPQKQRGIGCGTPGVWGGSVARFTCPNVEGSDELIRRFVVASSTAPFFTITAFFLESANSPPIDLLMGRKDVPATEYVPSAAFQREASAIPFPRWSTVVIDVANHHGESHLFIAALTTVSAEFGAHLPDVSPAPEVL